MTIQPCTIQLSRSVRYTVGDPVGLESGSLPTNGQRTATLPEGSAVDSVAFSPNGQTLAAGDDGGDVGLWDTASGRRTATLGEGARSSAWRSARTARRSRPATGGDVGLWDTASGRRTATLTESSPVSSVAFSPNGQTLAAGDEGGDVGLWDTASGRRTATLTESNLVDSVAFSPNGQTLAAGDTGGYVGLWDTASGQQTTTLAEGSPVRSVAFSPNGRTLAAGDDGGDASLWDTASGQRTATLAEGPVSSVAFSPNGRTLAAGDVAAMSACGTPPAASVPSCPKAARSTAWRSARTAGRSRSATSAAMSACGTPPAASGPPPWPKAAPSTAWRSARTAGRSRPATTGGDVSLWDTASGQRTATLAESSPVESVAFSPNGQTLAIGDLNGNVALLQQSLSNLTGGFLSRLICGEVRRNMSQAQWAANAPGQPYQKTCSAYP